MSVVGESVVVKVRVGEHDCRDIRCRRVVRVEAGNLRQDAFRDQLLGGSLRRAAGDVAAVACDQRHAQVEQDAGAVVRGDLDAHVADLVLAAVDVVVHSYDRPAR